MGEPSTQWKQLILQWCFVTQVVIQCSTHQTPRTTYMADSQNYEANESDSSFSNTRYLHEATPVDVSIHYRSEQGAVSKTFTDTKTMYDAITKGTTNSASVRTGNLEIASLGTISFPSPRFMTDKRTETVSLTSQDISDCAAGNLQLNITLGTAHLYYVQGGNVSHLSGNVTFVCSIFLQAPEDKVVLLKHRQFSSQRCWGEWKKVRVSVFNDVDKNQFTRCPAVYNMATSLNHATVKIKIINSSVPFEIEMDFEAVRLLETIYTAATQGKHLHSNIRRRR